MDHLDAAPRYARALFGLSPELSIQSKTLDQLRQMVRLIDQSPLLSKFLLSPVFSKQKKKEILFPLLKSFDSPHLLSLFDLLLKRGNLSLLSAITTCYELLFLEKKGVVKVRVETALPLPASATHRLTDSLKTSLKQEVVIEEAISPSLLGGIRLSLKNKSLNDSIKDKLSYLKSVLSSTASP